MILIPSRGRPMIKHSSLLMPLRTPCVVLAYLELRLSSVRVPCGCPVDFRATSTNGYSAWIAIGFTLVILCRDRRSSPMGDGLLGEPGVRPCISLAWILQIGTTRARRRSDVPDGAGPCTSLPWKRRAWSSSVRNVAPAACSRGADLKNPGERNTRPYAWLAKKPITHRAAPSIAAKNHKRETDRDPCAVTVRRRGPKVYWTATRHTNR